MSRANYRSLSKKTRAIVENHFDEKYFNIKHTSADKEKSFHNELADICLHFKEVPVSVYLSKLLNWQLAIDFDDSLFHQISCYAKIISSLKEAISSLKTTEKNKNDIIREVNNNVIKIEKKLVSKFLMDDITGFDDFVYNINFLLDSNLFASVFSEAIARKVQRYIKFFFDKDNLFSLVELKQAFEKGLDDFIGQEAIADEKIKQIKLIYSRFLNDFNQAIKIVSFNRINKSIVKMTANKKMVKLMQADLLEAYNSGETFPETEKEVNNFIDKLNNAYLSFLLESTKGLFITNGNVHSGNAKKDFSQFAGLLFPCANTNHYADESCISGITSYTDELALSDGELSDCEDANCFMA